MDVQQYITNLNKELEDKSASVQIAILTMRVSELLAIIDRKEKDDGKSSNQV